jgi:hypothetical protein
LNVDRRGVSGIGIGDVADLILGDDQQRQMHVAICVCSESQFGIGDDVVP